VIEPVLVDDSHAQVGEGPVWHAADSRLTWVDIMPGVIRAFDPTRHEGSVLLRTGQPTGAALGREHGGLVAAARDGFLLFTADGALEGSVAVEADMPGNRMNDAKIDPAGRLWAGTMAFDESPGAGSLYRLDPDLAVSRELTSLDLPNGLDWSPDGHVLYLVDSIPRRIDAFEFEPDAGTLGERRTLATFVAANDVPDGMTVDADGRLWISFWGAGRVRCLAPDGELLEEIELPVPLVTSCAFGGPSLGTLFITTAAGIVEHLDRPSGGLFATEVDGVHGRPMRAFGG
jgi:sugar lactone lactonase YvrE